MATKTTVIIRQLSGPQLPPPGLNYQVWTSAYRLTGDGEVTLPAPQPVRLDAQGNGSINVRPGVWYVDQIVPQGPVTRSAFLVPNSVTSVYFDQLAEVTNTDDIGYGPTWSQQAVYAAALADDARVKAEAAATRAEAVGGTGNSGGGGGNTGPTVSYSVDADGIPVTNIGSDRIRVLTPELAVTRIQANGNALNTAVRNVASQVFSEAPQPGTGSGDSSGLTDAERLRLPIYLTQAEYDSKLAANTLVQNQVYVTYDN